MRWVLLSSCLLAAAIYTASTFIGHDDRHAPTHGVAAIEPNDRDGDSITAKKTTEKSAAAAHEILPNESQTQTIRQTSEPDAPKPSSNSLATDALPSLNADQHQWGELLRGAPVHSDPSISSAILGYGTAGTQMQLVKRELGWVKVRDPATSREGWIYEGHVTPVERPSATGVHEAALASETEEVSKPTTRSFKSKKPRKAYKTKKSAKTYASQKGTSAAQRAYSRCKQWNEGLCVY
jgi:Bacterial SH3 domain